MERERRQEDKEAEQERRDDDKRGEERKNKRERKRELKQLALERQREARDRQREAQDRQRETEVTQEQQRYTWQREHEVDPFAEDEHTTSEENKSQEMDDYWTKRTQHEQKKEHRRVVSNSADGRLHKKRPRLASGAALEEGENEKRRYNHRKDKHIMGDSGRAKRAYTTDSESRRKRNKRICKCD